MRRSEAFTPNLAILMPEDARPKRILTDPKKVDDPVSPDDPSMMPLPEPNPIEVPVQTPSTPATVPSQPVPARR